MPCAVNPSRVSPTFSDAALREVVDSIATRTASLLEIVNYNVEVSLAFLTAIYLDFLCIYRVNNMSVPENLSLCRLTNVLNYLKVQKIDFAKVNTSSCSNFFHYF
jgi:fatty acid synthase subunit alpha, fungi type